MKISVPCGSGIITKKRWVKAIQKITRTENQFREVWNPSMQTSTRQTENYERLRRVYCNILGVVTQNCNLKTATSYHRNSKLWFRVCLCEQMWYAAKWTIKMLRSWNQWNSATASSEGEEQERFGETPMTNWKERKHGKEWVWKFFRVVVTEKLEKTLLVMVMELANVEEYFGV